MSFRLTIVSVLALLAATSAAGSSLRDLAARIDFGYYGGDAAVVAAAAVELGALGSGDPSTRYLEALAQWRLAELGADPERMGEPLARCVGTAAELASNDSANTEAHVLVALCSMRLAEIEPLKGPLHARRADRALALARRSGSDNPRVAYVEARMARQAAEPVAMAAALERAAAGFDAARGDGPDWGEAETRLLLAESYMRAGRRRDARDAVERALHVAPGYAAAIDLARRLADER